MHLSYCSVSLQLFLSLQVYYSCYVLVAHWSPYDENELDVPQARVPRQAPPLGVINSPSGLAGGGELFRGGSSSDFLNDALELSIQQEKVKKINCEVFEEKYLRGAKKVRTHNETSNELFVCCSCQFRVKLFEFSRRESNSKFGYAKEVFRDRTICDFMRELTNSEDINVKLWKTRKMVRKMEVRWCGEWWWEW